MCRARKGSVAFPGATAGKWCVWLLDSLGLGTEPPTIVSARIGFGTGSADSDVLASRAEAGNSREPFLPDLADGSKAEPLFSCFTASVRGFSHRVGVHGIRMPATRQDCRQDFKKSLLARENGPHGTHDWAPGPGRPVRQADWRDVAGRRSRQKERSASHFLREPCAGRREAAGEALASGRRGPGCRATKTTMSGVPRLSGGAEGSTLQAGSARQGGTPRDPGGLDAAPAIASGSPEEGDVPAAPDARHRGVGPGHGSDGVREQKGAVTPPAEWMGRRAGAVGRAGRQGVHGDRDPTMGVTCAARSRSPCQPPFAAAVRADVRPKA